MCWSSDISCLYFLKQKPKSSPSHRKFLLPHGSPCRPLASSCPLSLSLLGSELLLQWACSPLPLDSATKYLTINNWREEVCPFTMGSHGGARGSWPHFIHSQEGESGESRALRLRSLLPVLIQSLPGHHGMMPPTVGVNQSTSVNLI